MPSTVPPSLPRAIATGVLKFPGVDVQCHVLSDDRRILDTTQTQTLLGAAKDRHFARMIGRILSRYAGLALRPSIAFTLPAGGVAHGYEAAFVMDVCFAYQAAYLAGKLHPKQTQIALRAMGIVSAYAKIGLDAAIDEATGHQRDRPEDYFQRRVDVFLRDRPDKWRERWGEPLVIAFCRLYRRPHNPERYPTFMRGVAGHVYDMVMGARVMLELRRRNPRPRKRHNHHQHLREQPQQLLERDLVAIQAIAETSVTAREFWARMRTKYRGAPLQRNMW
jgi:hypothetical protein